MKRMIVPEKDNLSRTGTGSDTGRRSVTFRLDPTKKEKIEAMVNSKGKQVMKIFKQWINEDKEKAIAKKKDD